MGPQPAQAPPPVFYPGTFFLGGGISPQTSNSPPQELEARSVYYVNVIPVSLPSAQNLQSNSAYLLTHLL